MYHVKVMIVDGLWVSVGSTNFDNRSFSINDEANLNVYDAAFSGSSVGRHARGTSGLNMREVKAMRLIQLPLVIVATLTLTGCEVIGTIFEAGVWFGIIAVVLVLAIIGFIVSRFRR